LRQARLFFTLGDADWLSGLRRRARDVVVCNADNVIAVLSVAETSKVMFANNAGLSSALPLA